MKHALATILVTVATSILLPAQLTPGNYLVGTQGWDAQDQVSPAMDTIQMVNPYSNTATTLKVSGVPSGELPAVFIIESLTSFLMGTKLATTTTNVQGNVYRVSYQNGAWSASKVNQANLNINVSSMVQSGDTLYITGSDVFGPGNTSKDAQVQRVDLKTGAVTMHAQFGAKYIANGANGSALGLVLVGNMLHVFTFDSTTVSSTNPARNEHWAVTTASPAKFSKVGQDLPYSTRLGANSGFGASAALLDPVSGHIVVVGRWGNLVWRDTNGNNVRAEQWPGNLITSNSAYLSQLWRAATVNTDTNALAFGDHGEDKSTPHQDAAAIDERRCNGALPAQPFSSNVARPKQPIPGTFTISALAYVPTGARYIPHADGCKDSSGAHPCSYINSPPTAGNKQFALTLSTGGTAAALAVGPLFNTPFDLTVLGAPGCKAYVNPIFFRPFQVSGGSLSLPMKVPARAKNVTLYTQWLVFDKNANALGIAVSDARKVVIP